MIIKRSKFKKIISGIFGLIGLGVIVGSSTILSATNQTQVSSISNHDVTNNNSYDVKTVGYGTFKTEEPDWLKDSRLNEVTELWELNVLQANGTIKRQVVTVLKSNFVSTVFDIGEKPISGIYRVFVIPSSDSKSLRLEAKARVSSDYIYVDMYKSKEDAAELTPNTVEFSGPNVVSFLSTTPWTTIWIAVGAGSGLLLLIIIISLSIWGINNTKRKKEEKARIYNYREQQNKRNLDRIAATRALQERVSYKAPAQVHIITAPNPVPAPAAEPVVPSEPLVKASSAINKSSEKIEKIEENLKKMMSSMYQVMEPDRVRYMRDSNGQVYRVTQLHESENVNGRRTQSNIGYQQQNQPYYSYQQQNKTAAYNRDLAVGGGYRSQQAVNNYYGNRLQQTQNQYNGYYNQNQQQANQYYGYNGNNNQRQSYQYNNQYSYYNNGYNQNAYYNQ